MANSLGPNTTGTTRGPGGGLAWLLGDARRGTFLQSHWDRLPLHLPRDDADFYRALVTAEQVREIANLAVSLSDATKTRPLVELVGGEKSAGYVRLRDAVSNVQNLWKAHALGSTVLVQMAQRYWSPLARLCEALEADLRSPVDATLICTPAESQAFGRHFDRLNAIVIQIAGRKRWRLLGTAQSAPIQDLPLLPFETAESGRDRLATWAVADRADLSTCSSVVLEPGDLLYVPRGVYHDVWTEGEDSAHITLAIRPVTYVDLMIAALGRYAEHDPAVRAGLPSPAHDCDSEVVRKTLRKAAANFARCIDVDAALADIEAAYRSAAPSGGNSAAERIAAEATPTSTLMHVSSHLPSIVYNRGSAEFYYGDRLFRLPERAGPALQFVAQHRRFRVDQLPGLTPGGAMVLIRRLVRANVLRIADPDEDAPQEKETDDERQPLQ